MAFSPRRVHARNSGPFSAYRGMDRDQIITLMPVNHPNPRVRRVGFDLTDPYVEQCWAPILGPSSTLLLRRLPELWRQQDPAQVEASELSRSLGLGAGTGKNSRIASTMDRLVRFGFAQPHGPGRDHLDVYLEVPPLQARHLAKVPQWSRDAHDRLLGAHLEGFEGVSEHQAKIAAATARLDRVQHFSGRPPAASVGSHGALGR